MHLRPRFAELSQFQDAEKRQVSDPSAHRNAKHGEEHKDVTHTHKTCPCNDMKGLNKMPHETCWLYVFFVPGQFISICSICGNIKLEIPSTRHGKVRSQRWHIIESPMFWAKCCKKIGKSGRPIWCSISY